MNRPLTALFAALEALLVVGIGIGIPLVPLTIAWAAQYGLQIDWVVFWRAAVDIWLLGNGADLRMTLDSAAATSSGIPGAGTPFLLSIAPLGFALLTVLFGFRAGRRVSETPHPRLGILAAIITFGLLSFGATISALHPLARPSISQGSLLPTMVFAIGIVLGALLGHRRRARMAESPDPRNADPRNPTPRNSETSNAGAGRPDEGGVTARSGGTPTATAQLAGTRIAAVLAGWPKHMRETVATALRAGTAAAAAILAVSAVLVTGLLVLNYAKLIQLYESAHAGVLGGITLTMGQLALIPNVVIWATSWLVGPGFAIGTGSAVTPFATSLGPLPAIPFLGALPTGRLALGFLGLLVPVLAGFLVAVVCRPRLIRALDRVSQGRWLLLAGVGIGIVGGILLGLLAWASAGAAGPGRLVDVGPSPWLVGAFSAIEIGVAATIGLFSGGARGPK